jgi:hypothetical protein
VAARRLDGVAKQPVEHLPIGQIGKAVVRREVFDPRVGPGFFVRALEVFKSKRHIVGQPLQQFGEFRYKRVFLGGKKQHDANGLPTDEQWKCCA